MDSFPPKFKSLTNIPLSNRWFAALESIINLFCKSNGFNDEVNVQIILFNNKSDPNYHYSIELFGSKLRYVSPNIGSLLSLIDKSIQKMLKVGNGKITSSPGIQIAQKKFPFNLSLNNFYYVKFDKISDFIIDTFTIKSPPEYFIFDFTRESPTYFTTAFNAHVPFWAASLFSVYLLYF